MEVDEDEFEQPTSSSNKGEKKRFEVKKVSDGDELAEMGKLSFVLEVFLAFPVHFLILLMRLCLPAVECCGSMGLG